MNRVFGGLSMGITMTISAIYTFGTYEYEGYWYWVDDYWYEYNDDDNWYWYSQNPMKSYPQRTYYDDDYYAWQDENCYWYWDEYY